MKLWRWCNDNPRKKNEFLKRFNSELTREQLDDGGEDESLALLQTEELQDEDEEAHTAQDGRQDHGSLDSLEVGCWGGIAVHFILCCLWMNYTCSYLFLAQNPGRVRAHGAGEENRLVHYWHPTWNLRPAFHKTVYITRGNPALSCPCARTACINSQASTTTVGYLLQWLRCSVWVRRTCYCRCTTGQRRWDSYPALRPTRPKRERRRVRPG